MYPAALSRLDVEGGMEALDTLQKEATVVINPEQQQPDPKKNLACYRFITLPTYSLPVPPSREPILREEEKDD
jgi:hypothetical protein